MPVQAAAGKINLTPVTVAPGTTWRDARARPAESSSKADLKSLTIFEQGGPAAAAEPIIARAVLVCSRAGADKLINRALDKPGRPFCNLSVSFGGGSPHQTEVYFLLAAITECDAEGSESPEPEAKAPREGGRLDRR